MTDAVYNNKFGRMGGETTDASAEYPQDNTITSGLIPQTEVDKKYKFLHEDITKCLQDMDEASPRLEALEECFELFHPNDVDRELLITRTLLHHRGEMSAAITAAGIQLRKSLVEFMRANLNAAKHQLETGEKTGRLSAIHPEESRFFGGFYLRVVVPLNIDLEYHQDSRNL